MTSTTASTTYTGSVNTSTGGATYLTGLSSGLDTQSLINAAVAQKTSKADSLDAEVATNTKKIAAYQNLSTLTQNLQDSLSKLQLVTSAVGNANDFDQHTVASTNADGTSVNSFAASVTDKAQVANYSVSVVQTAKQEKVQGTSVGSNSTALNYTGSFTLGAGSSSAQINVTSAMSLTDIANAINNSSTTSGVSANILKTGSGAYSLILTGVNTAQNITATATSGDNVLQNLGINNSSGAFINVTQAAQQAIVNIDGTPAYSDTNNFDNILTGVSLTVYSPSTQTATMDVQPNYSGVETDINSFVTAYNALHDAINTQEKLSSDGSVSDDAVLFADSLVNSLGSTINALVGQTFGTGADVNSLANLGVTLDENNHLTVDTTKLENNLLENFSQVRSLFETQVTSSSTNIKLYSNTTGLSSMNLSFNVTTDSNGDLTGVSENGDSSLFTFDGNTITGAAGGPYAGLSFLYIGGTDSFTVSINTGLADQLATKGDNFTNSSSGQLANVIGTLTSTDTDLSKQSSQIRTDADTYRTQQIQKYSDMETKIQAAKLLQQQLTAITDGQNNNN